MTDQAPVSSQYVRHTLIRAQLPGEICDRLEIVTQVTHFRRAETTVQRPKVVHSQQAEFDAEFQRVLRSLPDADPSIIMTMGRTFTVEWAGITSPV